MKTNIDEQLIDWIKTHVEFVKTLNFSDEEIINHSSKILSIHDELQKCQRTLGKCINDDELHEVFYRTSKNRLSTTFVYCNKHQDGVITNLSNYWIKDFNQQWNDLNFSKDNILCEHNISSDDKFGDWRADLIKFLNKQLKATNISGLYLYGSYGIGKSYIMALFCNELTKLNKTICFVNLINLTNEFRKNKSPYELTNEFLELVEKMQNCNVLVLDEIGTEKFNYYLHIEILLVILYERYQHNLPTFFISNLDLKKLKLKYLNTMNNSSFKKTEKESNELLVDKIIQVIHDCVNGKIINLSGKNLRIKE